LAKVQEAKEIPTVKVLDAAHIPDKKSFPPRLLIMILGTSLALTGAVTWIFGKAHWDGTDPADPRKEFAIEVLTTVQASLPTFSRNGSNGNSNGHRRWGRRKDSFGQSAEKHEDGQHNGQ